MINGDKNFRKEYLPLLIRTTHWVLNFINLLFKSCWVGLARWLSEEKHLPQAWWSEFDSRNPCSGRRKSENWVPQAVSDVHLCVMVHVYLQRLHACCAQMYVANKISGHRKIYQFFLKHLICRFLLLFLQIVSLPVWMSYIFPFKGSIKSFIILCGFLHGSLKIFCLIDSYIPPMKHIDTHVKYFFWDRVLLG